MRHTSIVTTAGESVEPEGSAAGSAGAPTATDPSPALDSVVTDPSPALDPMVTEARPALDPAPTEARPALDVESGGVVAPAAALPRAGFAARAAAGLIDLLFLGAMEAIIVWTASVGVLTGERLVGHPFGDALELVGTLVGVGSTALFASYFVVLQAGSGQTLGKTALRIRVTTPRGESIGLFQSTVRFAGYFASALPLGLGFLVAMGSQRRAFHDHLVGTIVARA